MRQIRLWMLAAILTICGEALTSCTSEDNPTTVSEVTLEDALNDGTIVVLTFNVNGTDITSTLTEER